MEYPARGTRRARPAAIGGWRHTGIQGMKPATILPALLVLATAIAGPTRADNEHCPSDPGYVLDVPETVGLGQWFTTCVEAQPGGIVFILIAGGVGPTQTQFGPLCIGFPFITYWVNVIPPCGELCLDHLVECDPAVEGMTAHFQAIVFGPGPGLVGITNAKCVTAVDTGACIPPGDFFTFTQGAWGAKCAGFNIACLRDSEFDHVFPGELVLGDKDGADGDAFHALVLTDSLAVQDFLPSGSTPAALSQDEVDPPATSSGVLGGQLAAARLNVAFDDTGKFDALKNQVSVKLGGLLFSSGVHPSLFGRRVRDVLALADKAISGEILEPFDVDGDAIGDIMLGDLEAALDALNRNFDNGSQNEGFLKYP